jgi:hypothetical protein
LTPIKRPAESSSGPPELPERLDLAVERADDAHGQRLVEPEGVADRVDALAHQQLPARADRDRRQLALRRVDLEHREVTVGEGTDQLGRIVRLVGHRHAGATAALDDVEVGDDVACGVPDETGAGATWHLRHVHREQVALGLERGDMHHRGRHLLEQVDVGLFIGAERAARCHRARRRGLGGAAFDAGRHGQQRADGDQDGAKQGG